MSYQEITTHNRIVTNPDGHQYTVYQLITDFCHAACPHCGTELNSADGSVRTASVKGESNSMTVQIPMTCRNGHAWYFHLTSLAGEVTFSCGKREWK